MEFPFAKVQGILHGDVILSMDWDDPEGKMAQEEGAKYPPRNGKIMEMTGENQTQSVSATTSANGPRSQDSRAVVLSYNHL